MAFRSFSSHVSRPRLVVSIDGKPFTGKTHFMLTMPPPMRIFSIDCGLEGVVEDMRDAGADFAQAMFEDYSLGKPPLSSKAAIDHAREVVKKFHAAFREILRERARMSIGLDTGSEFWQLYRLADLGKLEQVPPMRYVRVNRLYRDLLNEIYSTPHNLVLVHRQKDRYDTRVLDTPEGPREVSVRVPGEVDRDGFKEIDGIVQVVVESYRHGTTFGFRVTKCRARSLLMGQTYEGEFATFKHLALDIFPNTNPEDWGM